MTKGCLIGGRVTTLDANFYEQEPKGSRRGAGDVASMRMAASPWIGTALVSKGATIGAGPVVDTMPVVTKYMAHNCVVHGEPAKVMRSLG